MRDIKEIWSIDKIEKVLNLIKAGERDRAYILNWRIQGTYKYMDINPKYYNLVSGLYTDEVIAIIQYLMQSGDVVYSHRDGLYHLINFEPILD